MNLVFCKRSGKKTRKRVEKNAERREGKKVPKKRGNLITLVSLIRLIQCWNRNEKPFSSAHSRLLCKPKSTGTHSIRWSQAHTKFYSICVSLIHRVGVYIKYICVRIPAAQNENAFCIPISIQHAAQLNIQFIVSRYHGFSFECYNFFSTSLLYFCCCCSASSCVDLTVKLINNAFGAIFLPPALFWVRLSGSLCICVYIFFFLFRHYNFGAVHTNEHSKKT